MQKFWFVWNPASRAPTHKHESKTSANEEAARLAQANPEQTFIVLEALGHFRTRKPVEYVSYKRSGEMSFERNGDDWKQEQVPL
jgi:hypothetical protein